MKKEIIIEGYRLSKDWMNYSDFPEPPDSPQVPTQESDHTWSAYRKAVKEFSEKYSSPTHGKYEKLVYDLSEKMAREMYGLWPAFNEEKRSRILEDVRRGAIIAIEAMREEVEKAFRAAYLTDIRGRVPEENINHHLINNGLKQEG